MSEHVHIITLTKNDMRDDYMLYPLMKCWQEQGIKVTAGPVKILEADIGILHVNRTWIPAEALPANPLQRPILNERVLDISKRHISRQLLQPDSDYTGKVIIKTDANYYNAIRGLPTVPYLDRLRQRVANYLPWQLMRELPYKHYPVLERLTDVPDWVWKRRELIVERFQPEIENGEFILRLWMFLGDHGYGAKIYSNEPVVKVNNMNRYEYLDSVPEALQAMRIALDMDYGKLDYVMINREPVLLDVNPTPTISTTVRPSARLLDLASGLDSYSTA
ncbi:MAG TPA: hypothetical protein VJ981_02535 [Gammaproteobacteria bacterium]|nr:hypothetical protein [Gammaproteobacteria bacterium]